MSESPRRIVPKQRYVSTEYMAREAAKLWPHVWLLAERSSRVAAVGSWITVDVGRESVLIVRTEAGLRAYHNACQHRGHRLTDQPCGTAARWTCPYHRWTYGHDGALVRVPDEERFGETFSREAHALQPVHVAELLGYTWVHLSEPVTPLEEWLGPVLPALEAYGLGSWGTDTTTVIDISANWKTVVDAWNESYHAQGIHTQILELLDDVNTEARRWGPHGRLVVPFFRRSPRLPHTDEVGTMLGYGLQSVGISRERFELGADDVRPTIQARAREDARYDGLEESQLTDCYNYYVFPNLNFVMWRDNMVLYRYTPHATDPGRSRLTMYAMRRGARESDQRIRLDEHDPRMEEVMAQDLAAVRNTQQGMASMGFEGLVLSTAEDLISSMHSTLEAMVGPDVA